jgi:hypothetical protein
MRSKVTTLVMARNRDWCIPLDEPASNMGRRLGNVQLRERGVPQASSPRVMAAHVDAVEQIGGAAFGSARTRHGVCNSASPDRAALS